jgi:hypothetical protein
VRANQGNAPSAWEPDRPRRCPPTDQIPIHLPICLFSSSFSRTRKTWELSCISQNARTRLAFTSQQKCDTYIEALRERKRIPLTRRGHKVRFDKRPLQPIPTRYLLRVWPLVRYGDLTNNLDAPGAARQPKRREKIALQFNLRTQL